MLNFQFVNLNNYKISSFIYNDSDKFIKSVKYRLFSLAHVNVLVQLNGIGTKIAYLEFILVQIKKQLGKTMKK